MGTTLTGDPRDVALRTALYDVLSVDRDAGQRSIRRTGIPA
jgi:hypothetical protein